MDKIDFKRWPYKGVFTEAGRRLKKSKQLTRKLYKNGEPDGNPDVQYVVNSVIRERRSVVSQAANGGQA